MTRPINDVLDDGAPGLQYFEQLGPRYVAAFGGSFDFYELVRPYDNERDMNIANLEAAAGALRQLVTTADAKISAQQSAAGTMQAGWQGEAAAAAAGQLGQIATMASEDRDKIRTFEAALSKAAAEIPGLVQAKADTVLTLMDDAVDKYYGGKKTKSVPTVGGLAPADIDSVIDASKTGSGLLNEELAAITAHRNSEGVTDIPDTSAEIKNKTSREYRDAIKDMCRRWLSIVFMPDYNGKVRIFTDQCTTTRIAVESLLDAVESAAAGVVERSYPSVSGTEVAPVEDSQPRGDQPKTTDDQTTTAGTQPGDQTTSNGDQTTDNGGQTTTAGTQTGDTTTGSTVKTTTKETTTDDSSTDDDSTTDDSDISTALSTLASTISDLGTTVSEALTGDLGDTITSTIESAGTSLGDSIEQLTEQASSLLSAEGQEASFQLGDTTVSIEAGANGLTLTTTDSSGATSQYTLSLDENGNPVLTQDASGETTDQGDESAGVLGSGTPQSGTSDGEPGASDGGVTSAPDATSPETPDLTDAPVTSEIGSGEESSGSVAGGVPVGPRPARQEADSEHVPSIDQPVSDPGDSGAVLAEAGPL
ncbi:hypothetical protein [Nocardia rhizosphaerae]|uniref:Type VII secretion system (Wss) protein ESAT-6 n=1 Tax=Nocardia rhizosphaerae TaxID=1691571 RepID=A0ABV8L3V7_9NOCA